MKSILFVVCASLLISSEINATIKGSCPTPTKPPGIKYWYFSYFTEIIGWYELGHTQETEPRTVYNTIEIVNLYPGNIGVINRGDIRVRDAQFLWDKKIDTIIGDFGGRNYYDVLKHEGEPFAFNYTTEEGKQANFWMPYYPGDQTAVLASCVDNGDGTIDGRAWFVSRAKGVKIPSEAEDIAVELTGKNFIATCQGDFC